MRRLLRSNSKMFLTICILSSFVIGLSYATFKVNSTSYKATNMMVSKLMYGISISEINKSTSTINGNVVIVPANTKSYFYVTISSINKIDSKYSLAYKSSNSVVVKYSDKSEYTPTEEIEGYTTTNTYSKVVKISIDNSSNSTSTEVTINAFGGYTHNSYTSIILDSGYYAITNIYEEGGDINFVSYTIDGNTTELSYEELVENNKVNSVTCENGSVAEWDSENKSIFFSTLNVPDYCIVDFSTEGLTPQFISKILADNPTVSERTDFSVTNTSNTTGTIYKTNKTEDGSIVYYYSGNTTNNWVKFGKYSVNVYYCDVDGGGLNYTNDKNTCSDNYVYETIKAGTDMYWRIIRSNEDGSVRLLYAGTSPSEDNGYIGKTQWGSYYDRSYYARYMYGYTSNLSTIRQNNFGTLIKTKIDNWYSTNLYANYNKYISKTAIYCNDDSPGSGTWSSGQFDSDENFTFGADNRINAYKPSYKCGANTTDGLFESRQAVGDKFSVSTDGGGNGNLSYGVALMTADEVMFAGGGGVLSSPYAYYYSNSTGGSSCFQPWWLMSPAYFHAEVSSSGSSDTVWIFYVNSNDGYNYGAFGTRTPTVSYAVRPVLSIDKCAHVTGTGTPEDPYMIVESVSTC